MEFYDHIGIYENALDDELCDNLIKTFELSNSFGFTRNRQALNPNVTKREKDDEAVCFSQISGINPSKEKELASYPYYSASFGFLDCLRNKIYPKYIEKYDVINDFGNLDVYDVKIQKTEIGGGYHVWHCENGSRHDCVRLITYIGYLNTVDEGGETEFLYQSKRIKAKKGTVIIFPTTYTHVHRGNPPLSNTKYVITGWIEF